MEMISKLMLASLTTRISPMVYVMMFVNIIIGFCFGTGIFMGGNESILYDSGVLVDKIIWGYALLTTATLCEIGFLLKNQNLVSIGGIGGFALWVFASISLMMEGHFYVLLTIALFHLIFHGYVILSSSLGVLQRVSLK